MKMKRKHEQLIDRQRSLYGDGKKWFRGPIIGKASGGWVYLATLKKPKWRLTHLPALMAVKSAEISDSALLQKEANVLSNFNSCPRIYRCFGEEIMIRDGNRIIYNLLLEYGSGGTLADLIKKGRNGLPESDVRRYARYILEGLDCVHSYGYVHCDLKPESVIIVPITTATSTGSSEYMAKIGDFGLAKRAKQMRKMMMSSSRKLRGTLRYSSPETVVDYDIQGPPSDVWDVGCIVFEMLTGKSVWDGKQDSEVEDILFQIGEGHALLKLPSEIEVSEEAKEFLKGCFARKPMHRLTARMLLHHPFVARLGEENSGENEEELSVDDDSEEKDCSPSPSPSPEYEADDELSSSSYFSDDWNLRVKKPKVDGEAIRVCSSSSYDAVDDELSSSCVSDGRSDMPLEGEERLQPGWVDWLLSVH